MNSNALSLILSACLAVVLGAPVQAATVNPNGVVLVNRGNGFERVHGPTISSPTDRVVVNEGSAQVEYSNGSKVELRPGRLYTIGDSETLHLHVRDGAHGWQGSHGAQGSAAGASGASAAPSVAGASAGIGGLSAPAATAILVVGGVIAANGIAAIAAKVSKPSSP